MKQIFILTLCILFAQNSISQNIIFPDSNFKTKLITQTNPTIDTNNDDEISISEAAAVTGILKIRGSGGSTGRISDLTGIEYFINATEIDAEDNELTTVDLSSNTALIWVDLNSNDLTEVDFSNNTNLETLIIGSNNLSALDLSNLSNLKVLNCGNMSMNGLNITNCSQLEELNCSINQLTNLDLSTNTELKNIQAHSLPQLTAFDISNNLLLETLECSSGGFSTLDVSNNSLLTTLRCSYGQVSNLIFGSNNTLLYSVHCEQSPLASINVSMLSGLTDLTLNDDQLSSIDVSQNLNLEVLDLDNNQLTTIDLESNPNLDDVKIENNQLQTVYLRNGNNNQLGTLRLRQNPYLYCLFVDDASINYGNWFRGGAVTLVETEEQCIAASQVTLIPDINFEKELIVQGYDTSPTNGETPTSKIEVIIDLDITLENISDLTGLEDFTALETLDCSYNPITNIDISANQALRTLSGRFMDLETINLGSSPNFIGTSLGHNELNSIDVSQLPNLGVLRVEDNNLTTVDVTNNLMLSILDVYDNPMTSLDIRNNNIRKMNATNTLIETLDFSNSDNINILYINNNPNLTYVNFKSGDNDEIQQLLSMTFSNLPNLQNACVDNVNSDLAIRIQTYTDQVVNITEDCLNEISGNVLYDINNNGCNSSDIMVRNLMIESASVVDTTATFTNLSGTYVNYVSANTYVSSIESALPDYFTVSPLATETTFTEFNEGDTVDFCIEANQTINDVNVTLIPVGFARPGFNVSYQLVYNNIGTTQLDGSITLTFDDSMMSFLNATETVASQTANTITFDYLNFNPFDTRSINLEFNVLPPPTVNDGDVLNFITEIFPETGDNTPDDNTYSFEQTVVNSYDPNDKQVLQGASIFGEDIEDYLDYIVRFQNTGSASAINVRIEDILDDKLEWTTLQPLSSSHDYRVEISNDNFVEFIFDDINLPSQSESDELSQGYIAFRIKPKINVMIGDIISGTADIFFDFNLPITTNTVSTEIVETLSVAHINTPSFNVFPNPTNSNLTVNGKFGIEKLTVIDINGRVLNTTLNNPSDNNMEISVKDLTNGIYFLKVEAPNKQETIKFVKN